MNSNNNISENHAGEKPVQKNKRPPAQKKQPIKKHEKTVFDFKLFGKWDSNVEVKDQGLKPYINLEPRLLPRSAGIHRGRFHKSKMHIVERLALKILVAGHIGKKNRITTGPISGQYSNVMKIVENSLAAIEAREKKNPIEVLVKAVENAAVREEVVSYQMGSVMAREGVVTAPQRRVDKALRFFAQGSIKASLGKKKSMTQALTDELLAAYKGSSDSFAIKEKDRLEKEATGSR